MKSVYILIIVVVLIALYLYSRSAISLQAPAQASNTPAQASNTPAQSQTAPAGTLSISAAPSAAPVLVGTPGTFYNLIYGGGSGASTVLTPSAADLHADLSPLALSLLRIPTLTQTHVGGSTSSTYSDTSSGKAKVSSFSPATAAQVAAAAAAVNKYLQQQASEKTTALSRVMNVSNYSGPTQYKASCRVASGYVTLSYTTYSQAAYAKGNVIISNYANQGAVSTSKLPGH